ncbi:MAG: hypothetical protein FK734_20180 [Asgard group archaeon]|nr:hypothetical protein [Asgard group archaeon]
MELKKKAIIMSIVLTIIFGCLIPFTWTDIGQFQLWQQSDIVFFTGYPYLTLFKTIHLIISIVFFAIGCYHVINIIDINKSAHTIRNSPHTLLKTGYYGKVRHPMYSMFLLIFISLSFALCSSLAIAVSFFVVLVLLILSLIEEKHMLGPSFGEAYVQYKKEVRRYFLLNWQIVLYCILLSFNIVGIFF